MITADKVNIYKAANQTDDPAGGGLMSPNEVVDGRINNLFPNISRIDRLNGRVQLRKVFCKIDSDDVDDFPATPARAVGVVNLSSGHDWSVTNETFDINVNGGGRVTITLDSACADLAAVIVEINAAFTAAGVSGAEAYDPDISSCVGIRTSGAGADKSIVLYAAEENNALETLGIAAGVYHGEDEDRSPATYSGAHVLIADQPVDPNVRMFLFEPTSFADLRAALRSKIEAYFEKSTLAWHEACKLTYEAKAGTRQLVTIVRDYQYQPYWREYGERTAYYEKRADTRYFVDASVNDIVYIEHDDGVNTPFGEFAQVVRRQLLRQELDEADATHYYIKDYVILHLSSDLIHDYPAGTAAVKLYHTIANPAWRAYGTVALSAPAVAGDTVLSVDGLTDKLCPTVDIDIQVDGEVYFQPAGIEDDVEINFFDPDISATFGATINQVRQPEVSQAVAAVHLARDYVIDLDGEPLPETLTISWCAESEWHVVRSDAAGVVSGGYGSGALNASSRMLSVHFEKTPDTDTHLIIRYTRAHNFAQHEFAAAAESGRVDYAVVQTSSAAIAGKHAETVEIPEERKGIEITITFSQASAGEASVPLAPLRMIAPRSVRVYRESLPGVWTLIASDAGSTESVSTLDQYNWYDAVFAVAPFACIIKYWDISSGAGLRFSGPLNEGDKYRVYCDVFYGYGNSADVGIVYAIDGARTILLSYPGLLATTDMIIGGQFAGAPWALTLDDLVAGSFTSDTVGDCTISAVITDEGLMTDGLMKITITFSEQLTSSDYALFQSAKRQSGGGIYYYNYRPAEISSLARVVASGKLDYGSVVVKINDVISFTDNGDGSLSSPDGVGFYDVNSCEISLSFTTPHVVAFDLEVGFEYFGSAYYHKTAVTFNAGQTGILPASAFIDAQIKTAGGAGDAVHAILGTDQDGNIVLPVSEAWANPSLLMISPGASLPYINNVAITHVKNDVWVVFLTELLCNNVGESAVFISYNNGASWGELWSSVHYAANGKNSMIANVVPVGSGHFYMSLRANSSSYNVEAYISNNGSTWTMAGIFSLGSGGRRCVGQLVGSALYWVGREKFMAQSAEASDPKIVRISDDAGATWVPHTMGDDTTFLSVHDFGEFTRIYVFCASGVCFYTDDGGGNWESIQTQVGSAIAGAAIGTDTDGELLMAVVGADGQVAICNEPTGMVFTSVTQIVDPSGGSFTSIGVNGFGHLMAGSTSGYLALSTDLGVSWSGEHPQRYDDYMDPDESAFCANLVAGFNNVWMNPVWWLTGPSQTYDRVGVFTMESQLLTDAIGRLVTTFGTFNPATGIGYYDGPRLASEIGMRYFLTQWECRSLAVCTIGAKPFIPGSFEVSILPAATGAQIVAVEAGGVITGDSRVSGAVDVARGYALLDFSVGVDPASLALRYEYSTVYKPAYDDLNTLALPMNGRVPVIRGGDVVLVKDHQAQSALISDIDVSALSITVSDASRFPTDQRVLQIDNEKILVTGRSGATFTVHAAGRGYDGTSPAPHNTGAAVDLVTINSDLLTVVTATAEELRLTNQLAHDYPSGSLVAAVYLLGDIQSRLADHHTQATWDGTSWHEADEWTGDPADGNFDFANHPVEMTNSGAMTERWAIEVKQIPVNWETDPEDFLVDVIGENVGMVLNNVAALISDIDPMNYNTMFPYFILDKDGWDHNWQVGELLRFDIIGADPPVWVCRAIDAGAIFSEDDRAVMALRGDVADIEEAE